MQLTIIRHTSVDVEPGVCYGNTDVALRPTFPEEAERVRTQLEGMTFDKVFTSPLSRCTRLAGYCGYPDAIRDERIKEMNFGDWEMRRFDEITDPHLSEWYADYINEKTTGGESFADMRERIKDFIRDLKNEDYSHVAIFCHGGVMMQLMMLAGVADKETIFSLQPPYGGIIKLDINDIDTDTL